MSSMEPHQQSTLPATPKVYQEFRDAWANPAQRYACRALYQSGQSSFIPNLLPEQALQLSGSDTLDILRHRWGDTVDLALSPFYTDPDQPPAEIPAAFRSPVAEQPDSSWLKQSNMVGVNVRTVGSFWHIIKYALTLPAAQDSLHLLPIWEAGVVGSIYGMSSWQLNQEFYSAELAELCPTLNTIDKQLRAVINLLHLMGKAVGMDVIPHTDRFSAMALAFPEYFEWLQRQDTVIVDHAANLHQAVQDKMIEFLHTYGPALPGAKIPANRTEFFNERVGEEERLLLLFGPPDDLEGQHARRKQLIKHLYRYGYEPVPATMAPPYRGLKVDPRPEAKIVDGSGLVWRDYLITQPQPMSRVFGPLARYKLYESLDNNANWEIDFSRPRWPVWQYVCEKYYQMQRRYGFDFMRGDMSHVQMRPQGVPATLDRYYDLLGAVKLYIQRDQGVRYFGYFAETFLAPRDVMSYGEEIDHLEAAEADTTLGDLQSTCVGSPEFLQQFRYYYDLLQTRLCAPNFTVMTADKDDPRFDKFYLNGNEARLFIAFFLADMPSYVGLGFETRDVHYEPAPNEHYTKLFVFHETSGPKATYGSYVWGQNGFLYSTITRIKLYLDSIWPKLKGRPTRWLIPPDATGANKVLAWTQAGPTPDYVFVVNTEAEYAAIRFALPYLAHGIALKCDFSTASTVPETDQLLSSNGKHYQVTRLAPGEGRVYWVQCQEPVAHQQE
jgi:hypothetical protein